MAVFAALLALVNLSIPLLWIHHATQLVHYKVLGVPKNATIDEIQAAYVQITSSLGADDQKLQKVNHAYYLLSDTLRRRDYDHFGFENTQSQLHSEVHSEPITSRTTSLNVENFKSVLESGTPWLVQIYSVADARSSQFSAVWEQLAEALEGQVSFGRVELGEIELAKVLSDKKWLSEPVFRQGLPEIVAFRAECGRLECLQRYSKDLTYSSILDWTATRILDLPRILYYSSQSLTPDFVRKAGLHKVKVIIFSETGERAVPYMREAAKKYSEYATFGCVLWRQDEASVWLSRLGVESAPAIVILKDPGMQPVIVYGKMNRTGFMELMEEHKTHVLPQLRSITARDLGCDPAGYSLGGEDLLTWYCVIAVGKPGYQLDQLRSTMRSVQEELESEEADENFGAAAAAFKEKRLRLSWLDGAAQKKFCYYFLAAEAPSSCGARQYAEEEDVARIVLIRLRRNGATQQPQQQAAKLTNLWQQAFREPEVDDLASLLVARYNGSDDVSEILSWMASTVRDGDTQEIPYFKMKSAPVLVAEETRPMLSETRSRVLRKTRKFVDEVKKVLLDIVDLAKSDTKTLSAMAFVLIMWAEPMRHILPWLY